MVRLERRDMMMMMMSMMRMMSMVMMMMVPVIRLECSDMKAWFVVPHWQEVIQPWVNYDNIDINRISMMMMMMIITMTTMIMIMMMMTPIM